MITDPYITTDAMHHIVTVISKSQQSIQLYVDGQPTASGSNAFSPSQISATNCWLGRFCDASRTDVPMWKGWIDEFRMYSFALSARQIAENYQAGPDVVPAMEPLDCADAIDQGYGYKGDLNYDCEVNIEDLVLFLDQWLQTVDLGG